MGKPLPLPSIPTERFWKEHHAHRYLSLAQANDGQVWVLLQDARQWAPDLPLDAVLFQRHPHAVARCDQTRRAFLRADTLVKLLSNREDVAVLKFLNWLEAFVLRPARQRATLAKTDPRYRLHSPEPQRPAPEVETVGFWASFQSLVRPSHWDPRVWRIGTGGFGLRRTLLVGLGGVFFIWFLSLLVDSLTWNVERVYLPWTWLAIALVLWASVWNLAWLVGGVRSAVRRNLEGLSVGLSTFGALGNAVLALWTFSLVLGALSASVTSFWSFYVVGDPPMKAVVIPGSDNLGTAPLLSLKGPVGVGSTRALKAALDQNPDIRQVVLRSPGGLVIEGMGMARLVKRRQLETVVIDGCASACTLVYVAGHKRWLGAEGVLGFHRSHIPGDPLTLAPTAEDREMGEWYAENGVSERFIQRALDTPADDLWEPKPEILISEGVSTDVWR